MTKTSGTTALNQDRTANKVNEITDITESVGPAWATPSYDAAGSMTTIPQPGNLTASYTATYDAWHRLVKLAIGGTTVAEYEYDATKQRIAKKVYASGVLDYEHHYYYNDNWQVLETFPETGENEELPVASYVWHPYYIDSLLLRDYDEDADGIVVRYYYTQDVNFNVLSILSSTGTVLERYGYMPYGQAEVLTASFTADSDGLSDSKNDITFTGQWYDSESRLMLYRHRYYHPVLGTFCSRDPIGYEGSKWNLYEYVGGRALIAVDPRGLDSNGGSAPSGKRCIFVLPEYYAGSFPREEDDVVIDVTDPSTITGSIIDHGCCSLKFIGHQGGSSNAGGTVFQTPEGNVQILGYNGIHEGIRSALQQNKCEKCKIEQVSCSEGDADYWRRRDKFRQYLATYTGCEVVSPLGNPKMFCIEHVKGCKKINAIFPPKQGTRCYSPNPTRPAPKPRLLPGVPYPYPPINLRF